MDYLDILKHREKSGKLCRIELEAMHYSKNTVFKTIYKFTDRAYFFVSSEGSFYSVYVTPKEGQESILETIADEFANELLDQELRSMILQETSKIRDAITTRALLSVKSL